MKRKFPYTHSLHEAFEQRVVRSDRCWGWIGTVHPGGYPNVSAQLMHRWMLERKLGRQLQTHEQCRHICGNRICTNPNHLEVGSNSDNQLDRRKHHGGKFGPTYRFTLEQEIEIAEEYRLGGTSYSKLAEKYGATKSHISHILRRHKCQLQNTESHTK